MSTLATPPAPPPIEYPDSDGLPMAENTIQYRWITTIVTDLRHLFAADPNVFIAGDLFWYPVQGNPNIRMAPDAMVAFGRPQGDRGSYRQWEEGAVAPQIVFEVLSPSNRAGEMRDKLDFYSRYGAEEYYIYDPDRLVLSGYLRNQGRLIEIEPMDGHVSPRLGIRFEMSDTGLTIRRPDGQPFISPEEHAEREEQQQQRAEQQQQRAEQAEDLAKQESDRAKQADGRAKQAEDLAKLERDRTKQAEDLAKQERDRAKQAEDRAKQAEDLAKQERDRAKQAEDLAKQEHDRAKQAEDRTNQERDRANQERDRANQERDRAKQAEEREKLLLRQIEQLRQKSAPPDLGKA